MHKCNRRGIIYSYSYILQANEQNIKISIKQTQSQPQYSSLSNKKIKRCFCLTSVCLSVAYIGPKSRTERSRKAKIDTEVGHVTRDSDTTFKVNALFLFVCFFVLCVCSS